MRLFGLISFQTRHFEAFSKNRPTAVRCWLTTTYRLPVVDVTTSQYKHNTFVYVLRALEKTFTRGTQKIMTISLIIHEFYYKVNSQADQVDNFDWSTILPVGDVTRLRGGRKNLLKSFSLLSIFSPIFLRFPSSV